MRPDNRTLCFLCGTPFHIELRDKDVNNPYDAYRLDDFCEDDIRWSRVIQKLDFSSETSEGNAYRHVRAINEPLTDPRNAYPFRLNFSLPKIIDSHLTTISEPNESAQFHYQHEWTNRLDITKNAYVFHTECMEVLRRQVKYYLQCSGKPQSFDEYLFIETLAYIVWNEEKLDEYRAIMWEHDYGGALECLFEGHWDGWDDPRLGSNPTSSATVIKMLDHPPLVRIPFEKAYRRNPATKIPLNLSDITASDPFAKFPLEILQEVIFSGELDFHSILSARQASKYIASKLEISYQHRFLGKLVKHVPWVWELSEGNVLSRLWRKIDILMSSSSGKILNWKKLLKYLSWSYGWRGDDEIDSLFEEASSATPDPQMPASGRISGVWCITNRSRIWECNRGLATVLAQSQSRGGICHGEDFKTEIFHDPAEELILKIIPDSPIDGELAELPSPKEVHREGIVTYNSYPGLLYRAKYACQKTGHIYQKMINLPGQIESIKIYTTGLASALSTENRDEIAEFAEEHKDVSIADFGSIPEWVETEERRGAVNYDEMQDELNDMEVEDDGGAWKFISGMVVQPGNIKLGHVPTDDTTTMDDSSREQAATDERDDADHETFRFKEGEKLTGFIFSSTHRGIRNIQILTDERESNCIGDTLEIYSARTWKSDVAWRHVRRYKLDLGEMGCVQQLKGLHANFDAYRMVSLGIWVVAIVTEIDVGDFSFTFINLNIPVERKSSRRAKSRYSTQTLDTNATDEARFESSIQTSHNDKSRSPPNELLIHVFSFLPFKDQLPVSLTCSTWSDVILGVKSLRKARYYPHNATDSFREGFRENGTDFKPEDYYGVRKIFNWDSSLYCLVNKGQVERIVYVCYYPKNKMICNSWESKFEIDKQVNFAQLDITNSRILNEPMLSLLNIGGDVRSGSGVRLKDGWYCLCDDCETHSKRKQYLGIRNYYRYEEEGGDSGRGGCILFSPHFTVKETIELSVNKGIKQIKYGSGARYWVQVEYSRDDMKITRHERDDVSD
ncbi:hypothetical protein TWF694_005368 [Orbilia ellipsospora]|uniref:F-box domain-containing protein n=1 Tax=Orbilia ellipsospora TaxID=2528407 RepID=A0AAV9WVD5_9PEZI